MTKGVIGRCIATGPAQLVLDASTDADYVSFHPTLVAELSVPIVFKAHTLGVLNLESASAEVFAPANVLALEALRRSGGGCDSPRAAHA